MERINYNSIKLIEFFDNLNPKNSGIFFSIFFHLIILLFAVGIPNLFGPKSINIPNIIPIEIINISDKTNIEKSDKLNEENKNLVSKLKKFNSSDNTEVQKQFEVSQNIKTLNDENKPNVEIKQKANIQIQEKKNVEIKQKVNIQTKTKIETIKSNEIKPKLKPKLDRQLSNNINKSDIQIDPKTNKDKKIEKKETVTQPKPKPKEDFSIASMLKDLRNEKSQNIIEEEIAEDANKQEGENDSNENMVLSITEIDLLRQQLSSCWNAPAGAVINVGDKVTISAKVQQNMRVFSNSVRIVDTNISKSNPFYGPITDSAMRTLLNPECTPLKLPKDKYSLWKNLTITFDYSIMKGY